MKLHQSFQKMFFHFIFSGGGVIIIYVMQKFRSVFLGHSLDHNSAPLRSFETKHGRLQGRISIANCLDGSRGLKIEIWGGQLRNTVGKKDVDI